MLELPEPEMVLCLHFTSFSMALTAEFPIKGTPDLSHCVGENRQWVNFVFLLQGPMGPRGPPGPSGAPVSTDFTALHHDVINYCN